MKTIDESKLAAPFSALPHRNPRVVASGNFATPSTLLRVLDAELASYRLFVLNAQPGLPDRQGVTYETPFVGPGMRGHEGLVYLPSRLSLVPMLFTTTCRPDVVLIHTSLPRDGKVSLGTEVNVIPAAIEAAKAGGGLIVAQMNPLMPYTYGDSEIPVEDVDYAIEVEEPLVSPVAKPANGVAAQIAAHAAELVHDGATLQLGIGAVPDAVLSALHDRRGLRIWTEMFSDGVLALEHVGALDPDAPLVTSFLLGSTELYKWVDGNERVRMARTETTNAPGLIAKQPRMTSVNSALQVDLFAQANASRVRGQVYSGFGGQTDFIVGALHSPGGTAIVALASWHPKADVSTVVPVLNTPVTSFQHGYIVSEQGVAPVWGRTQDEQARAIIAHVAHPSVREDLTSAGRALGLAL